MIAKVYSYALVGIEALLVEVEVDIASGLPAFATVGLPDSSVRESRERIKAALQNSGYPFPLERITVNLAPASLRKEGSHFDLPIAIAVLAAQEVIPRTALERVVCAGELSLDGAVKSVSGCLPMAVHAARQGFQAFLLPAENAAEAAVVSPSLQVMPVSHLAQAVDHLSGTAPISAHEFVAIEDTGILPADAP
ncbi:MAG: hypothetical protein D6773_17255, partial [Alphaproteobacteria bacterium]